MICNRKGLDSLILGQVHWDTLGNPNQLHMASKATARLPNVDLGNCSVHKPKPPSAALFCTRSGSVCISSETPNIFYQTTTVLIPEDNSIRSNSYRLLEKLAQLTVTVALILPEQQLTHPHKIKNIIYRTPFFVYPCS